MIEFGADTARSLRIWLDFFAQARIVGVFSKMPGDLGTLLDNPRVEVVLGAQDEDSLLRGLFLRYKPAIIIDDGAHLWRQQIRTITALFRVLSPDEIFIIEDTQALDENQRAKYGAGARYSPAAILNLVAEANAKGCSVPIDSRQFEIAAIANVIGRMASECAHQQGFVVLRRSAGDPAGLVPTRPARSCPG